MEPDLEGIFGVPDCFPGVLITGSHCLLDSGVVDPRDDACNFDSGRGHQDNRVRTCPNWLKWFLFPILNPYLISWLIGMNPIAQRNRCPFYGFLGNMVEDFSQGLEMSRSASFGGVSLEFSYHWGHSPIEDLQGKVALGPQGASGSE